MDEVLTPILVNTKVPQDRHIVIKANITNFYVDEQPMMVQNDNVIHCIIFLTH
jgi:hypothetical protein